MKWLLIFYSIFKPFISANGSHGMPNPIAELKEMIRVNAAKILLSLAVVFSLAAIFTAGIVMIAVDAGGQYDQNGYVYFSMMIAIGAALVIIPLIIGAFAMNKYDQKTITIKHEDISSVGVSHPLQDALALLVHDFVKEREFKRTSEEANLQTRTSHSVEKPHQSANRSSTTPISDEFKH
jgi:hypothetical protein